MRKGFLLLSTGLGLGLAPVMAAAQPADPARTDTGEATGEEIIVTAQRRTERAQDVPTALTVLSGEALQAQGISSLADYKRQVPNLNIIGSGGPGTGQPTIRGVSTGADRVAGIGIYLDDVPYTPSSSYVLAVPFSFDPDLADIERIEVLAGPQSTLYGASAMGGLIKFVSRRPDYDQFSGSARASFTTVKGGGSGAGLRASINGPLITDKLAISASAFYRTDPGFIDNLQRDETDVNRSKIYGVRGALRFKLGERLDTNIIGLVQNIDRDGPNVVFLTPPALTPALGGLAFRSPLDLPTKIRYRSISAQSTLDLDGVQVTNIASFSLFQVNSVIDYSTFGPLLPVLSGVPGPGNTTVRYNGVPRARKYSDELRIASGPGTIEWLLGAFITKEKGDNPLLMRGSDPVTGNLLPTSSPYFNVYTYRTNSDFVEKAAFGNLTWNITPELAVSGGARYSNIREHVTANTSGLLGTNVRDQRTSDTATTFLATVTYKPSRALTLYAKAGSAYRPGGINFLNALANAAGVPGEYGADKLWNYEVGAKGSFLDGRGNFTVNLFHMDWTDIQLSRNISGFSVIVNAAGAKLKGAEVAVSAEIVDGLTLSVNGAYLKTRYTGSVPEANIFTGNELPYAPRFRGTASLDYSRPVPGRLTPIAGISLSHQAAQNSPVSNATTFRMPAYDLLDLRAGVEWNNYRLLLRASNVTNEFGLASAARTTYAGAPVGGAVIQPRAFLVQLEAKY